MVEVDGYWGEGYYGEGYWGEGYWGVYGEEVSSLNSVELTVSGTRGILRINDREVPVESRWSAWEGGIYKSKSKTWGKILGWVLTLWEKGVAWADSAANSFEATVDAGSTVDFVLVGDIHEVTTTTVKILNVTVIYSALESGADYREFEVTLQEV